MTTKQLNFKSLPQLAVIDGATSPNLGVNAKGSIVYSTTLNKALMWDGTKWSSAGLKGDTGASGATASVATTSANGLMSSIDKTKLDGIVTANLLSRANHTGEQAISTVTGLQAAIDGRASSGHSHSDATTTSNGFMTSADKIKLNSLNSVDLLNRVNHTGEQAIATVTGLQAALNTKASTTHSHSDVTTTSNGFMTAADKIKLDGIVTSNLLNRANHTGEQAIATVTGLQTALNGKAATTHTHADATTTVAGFMSFADKTKLDGIVTANLVNRANHTGAQAISTVTGLQDALNTKASTAHTHSNATTTVAGFMAFADKVKLDGVATGANNYVHPANHPASIITQDANNRFVTDAEKTTWNAKLGSVKTINGQSIVGSGDLVVGSSSTFATDIFVNGVTVGRGGDGSAPGCTAIGNGALLNNISNGGGNTAIGFESMSLNTNGGDNTAVGIAALTNNLNGNANVCIGSHALYSNASGNKNTSIGYTSMYNNQSGSNNVSIGDESLFSNVSGNENIAIGSGCLLMINASHNIAFGKQSMRNNRSGSANICFGSYNSSNVYAPVFDINDENNRIVMGSTAVTNAYIQVAWTVVSDARDKTNFAPVPHGLDFVKKLKPVAYQFKVSRDDDTPHGGVKYGFKAQDILELEGDSPVIIDNETPDKLKFVDQHLIAVMVKAIQELTAKVERLENASIHP